MRSKLWLCTGMKWFSLLSGTKLKGTDEVKSLGMIIKLTSLMKHDKTRPMVKTVPREK